jgi:hypothetical protein
VDLLLLVLAVLLTSAGAGWLGSRRGCRPTRLREAVGGAFEILGLAVLFLLANTAVGAAIVLGLRAGGSSPVSLYFAGGPLVTLSLVQALVYGLWTSTEPPR